MSDLRFEDEIDAELEQQAVLATLGYRLGDNMVLSLSTGAVVWGQLRSGGETTRLHLGPLLSAQLAYQWLESKQWFLVSSFALSGSTVSAESADGGSARLTASDARISGVFGGNPSDWVSPFVAARLFGGPVRWKSEDDTLVGRDQNQYALGAGAIFKFDALRVTLAGTALGERTLSGVASWHF